MEYRYIFSIVMAIYNSEPFLRETLDSVVNQYIDEFELPFEEIVQVIMVDDGSTDGTAEIIDEYASQYSNFIPIHKTNGGVASARNEGLKYVEGKYMNFLDSDDVFSGDVLWKVYQFFEENYSRTDIVTIPLHFFDAVQGAHWQNGKFKGGTRVVDLFNEYTASLMFVNASFFKSNYKDKVEFDGALPCGEDIKYICTILSEKMTLGLVAKPTYFYRRRSVGEESLIQSSKKKVSWYFDYFTHLIDWGVEFAYNKWGYIPYYFQNIFVCDIKWRFLNKYEVTALSILGEDEFERYKKVLYNSLKHFDDKIILEQTSIWNEHKYMMLTKKYGYLPEMCVYNDDIRLRFGNTLFCWLSGCYTRIDYLEIIENKLVIEGYTMLLGLADDEAAEVMLRIKKSEIDEEICFVPCDIMEQRDTNQYKLGEIMFRGISFHGEVILEKDECKAEISFMCIVRGNELIKKDIRFSRFTPIGAEYGNSYYIKDGYILTRRRYFLYFEKCRRNEVKIRERKLLKELKTSGKVSDKKAYYVRKMVKLFKHFKKKIWLISDRVNQAGDNGEALFCYLCKQNLHDIDVYFVLDEESADYERLSKIGKVVPYFSHKHKLLHLLADVIISSHADEHVINPFNSYIGPYRNYIANQKFVFLQHGIIQNDLSSWLNKYNVPLNGFVTSAQREYDSIISGKYCYDHEQIWLTGLPRYDLLYHDEKRYITIMPTWRRHIMYMQDGIWYPNNKFMTSSYCQFYNLLLNDNRLLSAAKSLGYKICFLAHPNIQSGIEFFEQNEEVFFWKISKSYREVFAESEMIITDYSSVAFDFAYLEKPVIYTQFDSEEFFNGEHVCTKGYFDYEHDGFGEIAYNLETTIDLMIEYMKNGCQLKEKYRKRIDEFFKFHDQNNCQRVFERIKALDGAEK